MNRNYLVFGATGYIGGNLVPMLAARGIRVRAAARDRQVLEARDWNNVELTEADALKSETLAPALADIDVAFYLVHSMASGSDFGALDLKAADNFAKAAAEAGINRIVYLGGLVPDDAAGEHLESRRDTGATLRLGSVPVTELRAGIIIGPGSAALEVMRDLVLNVPIMITPRWVRATSPPIALDNLLEYLWALARAPGAAGKIYNAAGPEEVDYTYMMRTLARLAGKTPPKIIPVRFLTPQFSSYWLGMVTAVPAPVAKALITGLKHSFTVDDAPLRALAPQRLLTVEEAIARSLVQEQEYKTIARWSDGVFSLRGYRHENAYYSKKASASAVAEATPEALWHWITRIGGKNRYFYMNWLWLIREIMDWMVAGPGLTRGRRDANSLRLGDAIDYWTVLALQPRRVLTLRFGMRAPGAGALEFELIPIDATHTEIKITAHWHPRGVWGLMYWYTMFPAHLFLFRGWARKLARLAEQQTMVSKVEHP